MLITFPLIIFLFENPSGVVSATDWFEKYGWAIILLIVTNSVNYYFSRPKTDSDISKNFADTIKTYLQTIKEIQETNQTLFAKVQAAQDASESQRDRADELEEMLEQTKKELEKCLNGQSSCADCLDVLRRSESAFNEVETFLSGVEQAAPLLMEIRLLSEKISRTNSFRKEILKNGDNSHGK